MARNGDTQAQVQHRVGLHPTLLLSVSLILPIFAWPGPPQAGAAETPPARWWKGNLHTHTLWSDGDDYPEMVVDWYVRHGYHFLVLSDHNVLQQGERWIDPDKLAARGEAALRRYLARFGTDWVEERRDQDKRSVRLKTLPEIRPHFESPGAFLMIQGEEITARYKIFPVHLNGINLAETIAPLDGSSVRDVLQKNVDAVLDQRRRTGQPMFPHLNHPNFGWGVTGEDIAHVLGERFFEVYNGHPAVRNEGDPLHPSTERMWDIVLTLRLAELGGDILYGIATDDSHNYHQDGLKQSNPGRGWVHVRTLNLNAGSIVEALEKGDFYSSSGVTLREIHPSATGLRVAVDPQPGADYRIEFIGTRADYNRTRQPVTDAVGNPLPITQRYSDDLGAVLATSNGPRGEYRFKGDELYVRARVISSKTKANPYHEGEFEQAWIQPVRGPGRPR